MIKTFGRIAAVSTLALAFAGAGHAAPARKKPAPAPWKADVHLPSTPTTVIRGTISAERAPVLRIKDGQTVAIDTLSHGGLTDDPVAFFAAAGIPASGVLKDAIAVSKVPRSSDPGFGGHVLTGPIYIEGAEPGDMLEIRVRDVEPRVPYGVNNAGNGGVAPDSVKDRLTNIIKFDMKKRTAHVAPGVDIPLSPFMGIMAVAPRPELKAVGSRAPGEFGGNLDFRALKAGSSLFLPVFNKGALFYTGDSHAAQGDGEVSGNAIEASMTATFQFVVHKGMGSTLKFPRVEDKDFYYPMGLDPDLNKAYRAAVDETIKFLTTKGLTPGQAYSFSSVGIDFGVAQAVDANLGAYGAIPKSAMAKKEPFWAK